MIKFSASARLALGLLVALAVTSARAQSAAKAPAPKVTFRYQEASPGGSAKTGSPTPLELRVHVELAEGWHINSQAPLDSFLVPTTVSAQAEGWEFGKPAYPKPDLQHSEVMGGDLSLFTGAFDIRIPCKPGGTAKAKPDARPGLTRVTFNYQSCNNNMCLPPKSILVEH